MIDMLPKFLFLRPVYATNLLELSARDDLEAREFTTSYWTITIRAQPYIFYGIYIYHKIEFMVNTNANN